MEIQENPSSVPGATPNTDPPVKGTPASQGATPQTKPTTTLEEALARIAELEHSHKNAREQADRQAKKLSAYEKAEQEAKDAQLSEIERIRKQHAELQAQHDTYTRQAQERIVRYEVERQAAKLGIIDPDAAARLLDRSELEVDDTGMPTNAEKLLEKLVKQKPYLVAQNAQQPATPARVNAAPAVPAMNPGRTNIEPPDALPPGKMSIADAYQHTRRHP